MCSYACVVSTMCSTGAPSASSSSMHSLHHAERDASAALTGCLGHASISCKRDEAMHCPMSHDITAVSHQSLAVDHLSISKHGSNPWRTKKILHIRKRPCLVGAIGACTHNPPDASFTTVMRTVVQTLMPASDCMSTSMGLYHASLCSLLCFDVPWTGSV